MTARPSKAASMNPYSKDKLTNNINSRSGRTKNIDTPLSLARATVSTPSGQKSKKNNKRNSDKPTTSKFFEKAQDGSASSSKRGSRGRQPARQPSSGSPKLGSHMLVGYLK